MSDLIDTTEMYLRTVYELEEEGVPPLRARIAERLGHSGPTVSQTVARMERDGLLRVVPDRTIELSEEGRALAQRVMRKHRLAERLLTDVIGLDWALAHEEACRWEHVISEAVERRLIEILGEHTVSPYGQPIPALDELGVGSGQAADQSQLLTEVLDELAADEVVELAAYSEWAQADGELMALVNNNGLVPGVSLHISKNGDRVLISVVDKGVSQASVTIEAEMADHIFVVRHKR